MTPVLASGIGNLLPVGALKSHAGSSSIFELMAGVSLFVLATSVARLIILQRNAAQERERIYQRQREVQLVGLAARRVWERD